MKTVFISEFKARCVAIINEVNQTHFSVIITRRGKPIARLEPVTDKKSERILGSMGKMTIKGDIIHTDFSDDWEINGNGSSTRVQRTLPGPRKTLNPSYPAIHLKIIS